MTEVEMVVSMLGEVTTAHFAAIKDTKGFEENQEVAQKGGKIARNTRHKIEAEGDGRKVITKTNYLEEPEEVVRKKLYGNQRTHDSKSNEIEGS